VPLDSFEVDFAPADKRALPRFHSAAKVPDKEGFNFFQVLSSVDGAMNPILQAVSKARCKFVISACPRRGCGHSGARFYACGEIDPWGIQTSCFGVFGST
jgi:hypothetical protein